ncbi:PAS domain-containing sensor histidine kinase [Aquimarina agarivorans]|uniref:PAS domain-containing sensor histidine kinase n=1 Tax=Aquimarina agarivorans TaxID=980584 RepID=UPI000248E712|nr:PAS domain-containing sensor histidine kinase [Aquimarina agarivorans]
MLANKLFENTLKKFDIGYWELGKLLPDDKWSKEFYNNLKLDIDTVKPSITFFKNEIIHPEDYDFFDKNYNNYRINNLNFRQKIRLKDSFDTYQEFICYTADEAPVNIKSDTKLLFFQKITEFNESSNPFHYQETAVMSSTGSWFVDFKNKKSYWDPEAKKILGYPEDYEPSLSKSHLYYTKDCRQQAANLFLSCSTTGKPFDTEIKMLTNEGEEIWVRSIGKPIHDTNHKIIGIKGVFQNINEAKKRELTLQKSINIIASQNNRLFNFAHIVSHNLRSHSSNLSLLVQLIESVEDPTERGELIGEVKNIGENLNTTIEHLNEIVTIHTNKKQKRKDIYFKDTLLLVTNSIRNIISSGNASITSDFTEFPQVRYIAAYLESIILNLITNAIKYKHPERDTKIHLKTGKDEVNKGGYLKITDNGIGIDLATFGDQLFGMYKTFHNNTDAVGIGLFITKNQIESLNGSITVQSEVGVGTTFTISF